MFSSQITSVYKTVQMALSRILLQTSVLIANLLANIVLLALNAQLACQVSF